MLALLFSVVALIYASVGFGGGSSYLALLVLWDLPFQFIPAIALVCNIVVVSGSSFHYVRAGHLKLKLLWPLVVSSIPLSYLGGRIVIDKVFFVQMLFWALLLSGLRILIQHRRYDENFTCYQAIPARFSFLLGGVLGFCAGVTGIGGGIYLAPILYHLRAGSPKQIACLTSLFILLNSMAGLVGQLQKGLVASALLDYGYLPLCAFLGGQLGNLMMLKFISPRFAALLTGSLVLFVASQLALKIWG